jgi:homoserine O-acetyltransferase
MKQFKQFRYKKQFELQSGRVLDGFHLSYCTFGSLTEKKDNVIWVFHALTANADVADWWKGLFGDGLLLNPEQDFIICVNMPGSCYGSISPLDVNAATSQMYLHDFPLITIKDMVSMYDLLRIDLGITKIKLGIGGSMGGMQALQWASTHTKLFQNLILLATCAKQSPWAIAWNTSQRMAIESDSTWGNMPSEFSGMAGLKAARAMAMLSYRHYDAYKESQAETNMQKVNGFKAESYQYYQGEKLCLRYNAWSYYALTRSMDTHNIASADKSIQDILRNIQSKTLVIGIESDLLFPVEEQLLISRNIPNASLAIIDSKYGHDGFLIESEQILEKANSFFNFKYKPINQTTYETTE